jgi:hypothetical protein
VHPVADDVTASKAAAFGKASVNQAKEGFFGGLEPSTHSTDHQLKLVEWMRHWKCRED